jgi:hypothetical protein
VRPLYAPWSALPSATWSPSPRDLEHDPHAIFPRNLPTCSGPRRNFDTATHNRIPTNCKTPNPRSINTQKMQTPGRKLATPKPQTQNSKPKSAKPHPETRKTAKPKPRQAAQPRIRKPARQPSRNPASANPRGSQAATPQHPQNNIIPIPGSQVVVWVWGHFVGRGMDRDGAALLCFCVFVFMRFLRSCVLEADCGIVVSLGVTDAGGATLRAN